MFEFIFKLFMTGNGTYSASTVNCWLAWLFIHWICFHIVPYREMSNNILMISGKFQLFLCLISALLLKMEVSFPNDSSMQEMDIKFLSKLIIYSSVTLLVLWIITIFYDIWIARSKRLEEAIVINRERRSRLKFKNFHKKMRLFNSLKAKEDDDNAKEVGLLKEIRVIFGATSKEYQSIMEIMRQEAAETVEDKLRVQEEVLGAYISPDKPEKNMWTRIKFGLSFKAKRGATDWHFGGHKTRKGRRSTQEKRKACSIKLINSSLPLLLLNHTAVN